MAADEQRKTVKTERKSSALHEILMRQIEIHIHIIQLTRITLQQSLYSVRGTLYVLFQFLRTRSRAPFHRLRKFHYGNFRQFHCLPYLYYQGYQLIIFYSLISIQSYLFRSLACSLVHCSWAMFTSAAREIANNYGMDKSQICRPILVPLFVWKRCTAKICMLYGYSGSLGSVSAHYSTWSNSTHLLLFFVSCDKNVIKQNNIFAVFHWNDCRWKCRKECHCRWRRLVHWKLKSNVKTGRKTHKKHRICEMFA